MKVIQDLGLPAVVPGPGRVLGEGEAVEVAGDVAGTAGVGVLPPRPPQLGGLLQDGEPQLSHLESAVTLHWSSHLTPRLASFLPTQSPETPAPITTTWKSGGARTWAGSVIFK